MSGIIIYVCPNLQVTFSLFHSCESSVAIWLLALCYLCTSTLYSFVCNHLENSGYYTDHLQQQIISYAYLSVFY
jgi:hypothetical protein